MAFDESLARRIRDILARRSGVEERRMFGSLGFLLHGNLCVGVWKNSLIARLGVEEAEAALREPPVQEFDITGKAMRGWVLIGPEGVRDEQLNHWVQRALQFVGKLPAK